MSFECPEETFQQLEDGCGGDVELVVVNAEVYYGFKHQSRMMGV